MFLATVLFLAHKTVVSKCFFLSSAIVNGRFDPHFPLQHQQKDLRLVLGLGDSVEQPLFLAAAANELYKKARRMGYGEGDVAAVFKAASMLVEIVSGKATRICI